MDLPNRPTKDPYEELPVKDFSYVNTQKNPSKSDKKHQIILVAISLLVLVVLGTAAYFYGYATRDNKKKESSSSSVATKTLPNNIYSPTTTSYTSNAFGFNIKYPSSWQVSSATTNNVQFSSPVVPLTTDTGKTVNGKVIMSVVNEGQIPAGFGSSSVAVLSSVDLSFNNPSSDQAAQSYISFIQYPATNIMGGLDGIYLTGNNGYLKDDTIPNTDVNQMSPLIYLTFFKCSNSACTTTSPLTISSSMWSNTNFASAISNMIKSIIFS